MNAKSFLIIGCIAAGVFWLLTRSQGHQTTDGKELFFTNGGDGYLYDQYGGKWL